MSKTRTKVLTMQTSLALALLLTGCGLTGTDVEDGATTRTADEEIPGTHSPDDLDPITAERWIDRVKVGRSLDINGSVPKADVTESFLTDEPIHLSMEVTDAPAGTVVQVAVVDSETGVEVWSQQRSVSAGKSHLSFSLNASDLGAGDYRAEVTVGDETVVARSFAVNGQDSQENVS